MSEPDVPRRMRLIAVSAALIALVFTLVAVIVVLTRGDDAPKPVEAKPAEEEVAPLADHTVLASNVARIKRGDVELVVEAGVTKGVRLKDDLLGRELGLEHDDIIVALSGKPMTQES